MTFVRHKTLLIISLPLIFFFLALYIWQVNTTLSTKALYNSSLRKLQELGAHNQELELLLSRREALGNIEGVIKGSFEPVAHIVYLRILEGVVARSYGENPPP